jgi:acetylornithine/N-succinyldiaminopimelate aminotransferase
MFQRRGPPSRTSAAILCLAGNAEFRAPFGELPGPVLHLPYHDESALRLIDERVAAVVIEPVQAEGGVRIPHQDFLAALRRRCSRSDALLIFDEVLTGFGRTGRLFALEHFAVNPDLVVLAKALGGGLPLGAFCGPDAILAVLSKDPPLGHITTFGGHPLSLRCLLFPPVSAARYQPFASGPLPLRFSSARLNPRTRSRSP